MAQSPFEALVSGIKTGREVGTEVAQSNILQEVYKGTTPEAMTPDMQQAALTKASVLAGQKGLGSLQHIFQKEAGEVATANQESKLNEIKLAKTNLGYASQLAQGAKDPSDLLSAVDAVPNLATNEKMILRSIANDPRMPFEQKQKMFVKMGQTALQNAEAEYKLAVGEARLEDSDTRKLDVIRKEKAAATKQSSPDKEIASLDKAEAADLSKVEINPYVTDKEKAKANIRAEYEAKRQAARERRSGGKEPTKKPQFVEGQIYEDANGNRAKYSQGRWIPVK